MRLTPERAADLMGCSAQYVRIGLQQGAFGFGKAICMKKYGRRYTYWISAELFEAETGITVPELHQREEGMA